MHLRPLECESSFACGIAPIGWRPGECPNEPQQSGPALARGASRPYLRPARRLHPSCTVLTSMRVK
eukprot:12548209-Alexandrium_andersonii.AAC.1